MKKLEAAMNQTRLSRAPLTIASVLLIGLATVDAPAFARGDDPVALEQARTEILEERLLDVGIQLFDPGLPEDEYERYKLEDEGIYTDVRKAEARYFPMQLKSALQTSGFWGAVRLVPASHVVDLRVGGRIRKSNGKHLELDIIAVDVQGKEWIEKTYKAKADPLAYVDGEGRPEPFQSLYNRIANDLHHASRKMDTEDVQRVRRIAELRFANYLAPSAFGDYLSERKSKFKIERLPSDEDPMMVRLDEIRERDFMFVDTLNEYYSDFDMQMTEPYRSWRAFAYEEQVALDSLNRTKWIELIGGAAAVVGGAILSGKGRGGRIAGQGAMIGGMIAIQDGLTKGSEAKMHREALRELAASFDSEVAPILIDVEGEVLRLTGSVETQYESWRQLLRQIFATEVGLPLDPNAPPIPATGERPQN